MQRRFISLAILALAGLSSGAAPPQAAAAPSQATQVTKGQAATQLPRNARPTHYALSLTPDAKDSRFSASVTIALDILQASDSLTLNAADLAFSAATISAGPGQPVFDAVKTSIDAARQTATFHFGRTLAPGSYQLKLAYTGLIGTQAIGLFSLDYEGADGKRRALYTQFENSDARRMLPSWDEPAYKASFALEAVVPAGQMAISNMPLAASSTLADGRQVLRFATTPKMSTYLLFFAMGEFERATATEDGVELGVVTRKGALALAEFPLASSRAVLREYNDYFGVKFPLPKLDNVAAPGRNEFFGAMENWGAIFTFEHAMLLDPRTATQTDKETSFLVAAHEIAHQWFGDLVTMRWWDELWLNEGFASWMESRTTARLHPEWHWELRTVETREKAMEADALASTHPVVQKIATVEQANQAFDSITYSKGESVIGMLENYVGADAWRAGVRSYIAKHAYGNTVSDDLWREMEQAAHKPITAIAHDFTLQKGVPLIRVADAVCRNGASTITLTQGEFSQDQPHKKPLSWRVPVVARSVDGAATARTVVSGGKASIRLPGCGAVLVNAGQGGYYRTLYAPKAYAALAAGFAGMPAIDQLGLLADSWSLGMAGLQPASGFLELAHATPPDAAPQVWSRIAGVLADLHTSFEGRAEQRERLDRYARARLAPVLARLGWTPAADEAGPVAKLREELIKALSAVGDPQVIAEARRRYALSINRANNTGSADATDANPMPAALRRAILGVVAAHADAATWEQLRAAARQEKSAMVKTELYELLGTAADPALARQALALAISEEPDATSGAAIVSRVAERHPDMAFDFALAHREQIEAKVDASSRSRYFARLGRHSADPAMVGKLRAYAERHLAAEARGDADSAIAAVEYRVKVRDTRLPEIERWLIKQEIKQKTRQEK